MELLIAAVFVLGYAAIALEHPIGINKAASALLTGVLCWTIFILGRFSEAESISHSLIEHLGDISGILFFLLGAMTIVELVDMHNGFDVVTNKIKTTNKAKLLWIIAILTFFFSAILDNLTTSIVMVSLLRKLIKSTKGRMLYAGMIVIAANAGGAWSPIGDVTTTMLWIQNKITTVNIVIRLILPSLVCMILPMLLLSWKLKGRFLRPDKPVRSLNYVPTTPFEKTVVFWTGVGALVFVPIFKAVTHLPPFMGMMFGLGILWIVTEVLHGKKT
ncbi:MAG: sodium:proton antiporter NhaD, partial [Nitrosopumilus sp.]|nr:sodium:proton antiporter NhaD [Nitrosopumilus sp.]